MRGRRPALPQSPPRIDFTPADFDAALREHGAWVYYERSARCGCRNSEQSDTSAVGCPLCSGRGWEYYETSVQRALLSAMDLEQDSQEAFGDYVYGMLRWSMPAGTVPGLRDRFTNLDSLMVFSEVLTGPRARGLTAPFPTGEPLPLRYFVGSRRDDLLPQPVPPLTDSQDPAALGQPLIDDAPPSADGDEVERDVLHLRGFTGDTESVLLERLADFEVRDGEIVLKRPGVLRVSVAYLCHPRYTVLTFRHTARDRWLKTPRGALARMPLGGMAKLDFLEGNR